MRTIFRTTGIGLVMCFFAPALGCSGSAGPDTSEQYPIENGTVDGNKATFAVTTGEWKFAYALTLKENSLSGDLTLESTTERRKAKVTLTRTNQN